MSSGADRFWSSLPSEVRIADEWLIGRAGFWPDVVRGVGKELYVEHVFDTKDGGRGANSILTKQSRNMHALWDGLLGRDFNEGDANRRIAEIQKLEFTILITNPEQWLQESRNAAKTDVYSPEVLEPITVAMRSKSKTIAELDLSEA